MEEITAPTYLAEAVQYLRSQRGLSARALSLRAGLSASYVGKFEHREIEPSIGVFARIALALEMNSHELYYCIRLAAIEKGD